MPDPCMTTVVACLQWELTVVLICIALAPNDIEHLLTCLSAMSVIWWVKSLLVLLACFLLPLLGFALLSFYICESCYYSVCMVVGRARHSACAEVRGQPSGLGPLLLPSHRTQDKNTAHWSFRPLKSLFCKVEVLTWMPSLWIHFRIKCEV